MGMEKWAEQARVILDALRTSSKAGSEKGLG